MKHLRISLGKTKKERKTSLLLIPITIGLWSTLISNFFLHNSIVGIFNILFVILYVLVIEDFIFLSGKK